MDDKARRAQRIQHQQRERWREKRRDQLVGHTCEPVYRGKGHVYAYCAHCGTVMKAFSQRTHEIVDQLKQVVKYQEVSMTIHKTFEVKVLEQTSDGGRIFISTASVDRDRDRVFPKGARIDDYLKNPVVQWGHNYKDPFATIGKTNHLEISDEGIVADFTLRPAANDQDPQNIVRLLWNGGWVRTASIGFIPTAGKPNDVGGTDFLEWQLLEWSLVPVPANQDALRLAVKSFGDGIDIPVAPKQPDAQPLENQETLLSTVIAQLHETSNVETKRGRVLSSKNEEKIIAARDALNDVLAQLDEQTDEPPLPRHESAKGKKQMPSEYIAEALDELDSARENCQTALDMMDAGNQDGKSISDTAPTAEPVPHENGFDPNQEQELIEGLKHITTLVKEVVT